MICKLNYINQYNYLNTGNADVKPGGPGSLNNTYTGNLFLKNENCNKVPVNYKPNNLNSQNFK